MARKKSRKSKSSKRRSKSSKRTRRHSGKRRGGKNQIPLPILEKRLGRLARVVAKRGGRAR